jgi:hypothetical protein
MSEPNGNRSNAPLPELDRKWIAWAIIIVLIAISVITGVKFPIPEPPGPGLSEGEGFEAESATGRYTHLSALSIDVPTPFTTATPGVLINNTSLGNALEIRDASTPVAAWQNDGFFKLVKPQYFECQFVATTQTTTLTPANNCYVVNANGVVTYTLAATGVYTGQVLYVANLSTNNVLIADTNLRSHDGALLTLGQYDSALLLFTGTEWYALLEIAAQ